MHHPTDRIIHTTAFVTLVVEHWLEREIAQWVHPMKDRSDDPSHHERTLYLWAIKYRENTVCLRQSLSLFIIKTSIPSIHRRGTTLGGLWARDSEGPPNQWYHFGWGTLDIVHAVHPLGTSLHPAQVKPLWFNRTLLFSIAVQHLAELNGAASRTKWCATQEDVFRRIQISHKHFPI